MLADDARQPLQEQFYLLGGVAAAKAQPQAAGKFFRRDSYGFQHVAGLLAGAGAGTAATCRDAGQIQGNEDALRLYIPYSEAGVIGKPLGGTAGQPRSRYGFQSVAYDSVP